MAISEAVHDDPDKVLDHIDATTAADYPSKRDNMLNVLKVKTLDKVVC